MDDWKRNCENSYIFTFKNKKAANKFNHILNELSPSKVRGPTEIPLAALAEKASLKTNPANDETIYYFYKCHSDGVSLSVCSKSKSHPTPMTIRSIAETICGKDTFSMTYWTENKETGVCASDDPSVVDHHWVIDSPIDLIREDACPATDDELIEWLKKKRNDNFSGNVTAENMIKLAVTARLFNRKQFLYYHYVEADMWGR